MRLVQAWQVANLANVFDREVIQAGMAEVLGVDDPGELPDPILPAGAPGDPGNTDNPATAGNGGSKNPGSAKGTGQGKSNGTGADSPNDHSTDQSSKSK